MSDSMPWLPYLAYIALAGLAMVSNRWLRLSDGGVFLLILGVWTGLLWAGMLG
jgi:hypothetical protein